MNAYLELTDGRWRYGSYYRSHFLGDTLYTCCFYKDLQVVMARGTVNVSDGLSKALWDSGEVDETSYANYRNRLQRFFENLECYDQWSLEQLYGGVHGIRKQYLGAGVIERKMKRIAAERRVMGEGAGIDQRAVKEHLIAACDVVLFVLGDPRFFRYMEADVKRVVRMGHRACVVVSDGAGDTFLGREAMEELLGGENAGAEGAVPFDGENAGGVRFLVARSRHCGIDLSAIRGDGKLARLASGGRACLFLYGDDGLFSARNLNIPAIVVTVPSCYYAKALAGQFAGRGLCTVYVPPHFDILPLVPLKERTRVSYRQMAGLCADFGPEVYRMGAEELYARFPEYFINIYGEETKYTLPLHMSGDDPKLVSALGRGDVYRTWCGMREEQIAGYLNGFEGIQYLSACLDPETMERLPVNWDGNGDGGGVLVQGAIVPKARNSRVILSAVSRTPRELDGELDRRGTALFSNFLFFLTPKLAAFYNELRRERPGEQIGFDSGHLDYMLCRDGERRVETFPLYNKACVAMKRDGSFLFFRYLLGGGSLTLGSEKLEWSPGDVNPEGVPGEICIYTPYRSRVRRDAKEDDYCEPVGHGRINFVVIQDRVVCARWGDVLLPSIGAVVSLAKERGECLAEALGLSEDEDGYFRWNGARVELCLDPPAGISAEEWEQVSWAYGGGMALIRDGRGIDEEDMDRWLDEEGWMSPLSRQTQESEIHKPARHPRTAVGVTEDGALFVLVYNGRTKLSRGADYAEMSKIARALVPGVRHMLNGDGGGSAMLGMAVDGVFMELSYPATSYSSPAGMARQINTILCIKQ